MGLSGRKVKQRIGNDPRNLSWADDASRFGQAYLEKFGWDASKGLGASGEGRTNAIKMSQKLDMLGIGMQRHQNDPDGIAWRQNRDFENLLQRLNEGTEATEPFRKARGSSSDEEEVAVEVVGGAHGAEEDADETKRERKKKKQKKRKALQEDEEEEKAVRDKRERKKRKKSKNDASEDDVSPSLGVQAAAAPTSESTPAPTVPIATPAPVRALPRAHRARIIAAKRMAASNSAALAEILGIPSSCTTATASPSPLITATASTTPTPATSEDDDPLQKLTTAAQSVGDYLRAKLGAKAGARPNSTALAQDADRDDDAPRAGLGAAARLVLTGFQDEPVRATSMLAAMFARGQAAADAKEEANGASAERADDDGGDAGDEEELRKSERRRAKEERRKKKEDRRRRKEGKLRVIVESDAEPPNGAQVVGPSVGEALPGRAKRKEHRESDILDDLLEHNSVSSDSRTVIVPKTKQKRDKSRKTGRDSNP